MAQTTQLDALRLCLAGVQRTAGNPNHGNDGKFTSGGGRDTSTHEALAPHLSGERYPNLSPDQMTPAQLALAHAAVNPHGPTDQCSYCTKMTNGPLMGKRLGFQVTIPGVHINDGTCPDCGRRQLLPLYLAKGIPMNEAKPLAEAVMREVFTQAQLRQLADDPASWEASPAPEQRLALPDRFAHLRLRLAAVQRRDGHPLRNAKGQWIGWVGSDGTVTLNTFGGKHGDQPHGEHRTASQHAEHVHQALHDWASGKAYLDNSGNYRVHQGDETFLGKPSGKGVIAPWNQAAKREFGNPKTTFTDALYKAATAATYTLQHEPTAKSPASAKGVGGHRPLTQAEVLAAARDEDHYVRTHNTPTPFTNASGKPLASWQNPDQLWSYVQGDPEHAFHLLSSMGSQNRMLVHDYIQADPRFAPIATQWQRYQRTPTAQEMTEALERHFTGATASWGRNGASKSSASALHDKGTSGAVKGEDIVAQAAKTGMPKISDLRKVYGDAGLADHLSRYSLAALRATAKDEGIPVKGTSIKAVVRSIADYFGIPHASAAKSPASTRQSPSERIAQLHQASRDWQNKNPHEAEAKPGDAVTPIRHVAGFTLNTGAAVNLDLLQQAFGDHQLGNLVALMPIDKLNQSISTYNFNHPDNPISTKGIANNRDALVSAITAHVTQGHYSADFGQSSAKARGGKAAGSKSATDSVSRTMHEKALTARDARLAKEQAAHAATKAKLADLQTQLNALKAGQRKARNITDRLDPYFNLPPQRATLADLRLRLAEVQRFGGLDGRIPLFAMGLDGKMHFAGSMAGGGKVTIPGVTHLSHHEAGMAGGGVKGGKAKSAAGKADRVATIAAALDATKAYRAASTERAAILRDLEVARRAHPYDANFSDRFKASRSFAAVVAQRRQASATMDKVARSLTASEKEQLTQESAQHHAAAQSSFGEESHQHFAEAQARQDLWSRAYELDTKKLANTAQSGNKSAAPSKSSRTKSKATSAPDSQYGEAKHVTLGKQIGQNIKGEKLTGVNASPTTVFFLDHIRGNPVSKIGDGATLAPFTPDRQYRAAEDARRAASPFYKTLMEHGEVTFTNRYSGENATIRRRWDMQNRLAVYDVFPGDSQRPAKGFANLVWSPERAFDFIHEVAPDEHMTQQDTPPQRAILAELAARLVLLRAA